MKNILNKIQRISNDYHLSEVKKNLEFDHLEPQTVINRTKLLLFSVIMLSLSMILLIVSIVPYLSRMKNSIPPITSVEEYMWLIDDAVTTGFIGSDKKPMVTRSLIINEEKLTVNVYYIITSPYDNVLRHGLVFEVTPSIINSINTFIYSKGTLIAENTYNFVPEHIDGIYYREVIGIYFLSLLDIHQMDMISIVMELGSETINFEMNVKSYFNYLYKDDLPETHRISSDYISNQIRISPSPQHSMAFHVESDAEKAEIVSTLKNQTFIKLEDMPENILFPTVSIDDNYYFVVTDDGLVYTVIGPISVDGVWYKSTTKIDSSIVFDQIK